MYVTNLIKISGEMKGKRRKSTYALIQYRWIVKSEILCIMRTCGWWLSHAWRWGQFWPPAAEYSPTGRLWSEAGDSRYWYKRECVIVMKLYRRLGHTCVVFANLMILNAQSSRISCSSVCINASFCNILWTLTFHKTSGLSDVKPIPTQYFKGVICLCV